MGVTAREPPAAREKACATIISRLGAPAGGNSRHRVEMAEDQVASAQLLRNFAPLDAMKRENLAALAKKVSVRALSAGRVLFNQGDTDKRTVWLVSGAVEVNENERNIGVLRAGTPETRNPLYPKLPRRVTVRAVDDIKLAGLGVGDSFGEEALIAEAKRNATITMMTDGVLMRLNKQDFRELMNEPLLQWVSIEQARAIIARGGRWLDVRLPSEHQTLSIEGALNVPLYLIRLKLSTLDRNTPYVAYCDTGRRSSAAAYILVERGFDAYVLTGGMNSDGGLPLTRGGPAPKP